MSVTTLQGHQQDSATTDIGLKRPPRELAPWLRRAGQALAFLSIPGAAWPLWELLTATPWGDQDWTGRLGQTTWVVLLLLIPVGAFLALRRARTAGQLLLAVGAVMLTWAVIGRLGDTDHWAEILPLALIALIVPVLAAATLLLLARGTDTDEAPPL